MSTVNKVILIGNVGQDPEMRYLPNGDAVVNLSLATSESWTDKASGDKKEVTEWHRVQFFGRLAEVVGEYVKKGAKLFVEGSLRTRKWQDKDGSDRYTTEIRAVAMKMLDRKAASQDDGGDPVHREAVTRASPSTASGYRDAKDGRKPAPASSTLDDMDDDIPF